MHETNSKNYSGHVDSINYNKDNTEISCWIVDKTSDKPVKKIDVFDKKNNKKVKPEIEKIERKDVYDSYNQQSKKYLYSGFNIKIPSGVKEALLLVNKEEVFDLVIDNLKEKPESYPDVIVIDDVIPKDLQEKIKTELFNLPWYYSKDVTFGDGQTDVSKQKPAMTHSFSKDETILELLHNIPKNASYMCNQKWDVIENERTILQFPLTEKYSHIGDSLHVDLNKPHTVCLYYALDADGETVITNRFLNPKEGALNLDPEEAEEIARVAPKQGRCVIFNGSLYHTAEQPKHSTRMIVNFNIPGAFEVQSSEDKMKNKRFAVIYK